MKRTPLWQEHRAVGARMAPFAGWDMPVQYRTIIEEHQQTRTAASIFDTCHMGEFDLSGATAARDLDRLLTCAISTLSIGQCRYGYLLDERGGVIDDLTCYRLGEERYRLVVNAGTAEGDAEWVRSHLSSSTAFEDASERTAKIDLQGPASREILAQALDADVPELKFFRCAETKVGDLSCLISRTGYTGEWGYELYFAPERAAEIWQRLIAAGAPPAGLGARDTLRLEMGYPLYGHELTRDRTPAGAAGGVFIDPSKPFIGRAAVARELDNGPGQRLIGLKLDGRRAARAGDRVLAGERPCGTVTSGSLAPSLGVAVAMAWVDRAESGAGTTLSVDVRGRALPAVVTPLPFYTAGTARKPQVAT